MHRVTVIGTIDEESATVAQPAHHIVDRAVLDRQLDTGDRRVPPAIVAKFYPLPISKMQGNAPRVRREYLQLVIHRVEVGDRYVRISGQNAML
ncbi:hypothetical protein [Sphingomonas oligophenolica]|uniref:Uncharacterized protein n=1 Tax=Sphingomonas oligophenolica TaxID=301154 RepID=A0A502CEB0_9SPHN|nr:hypothetical protein [Sphingomonas oligophenolica]TPG12035.1 hypothetical protein EAH84_11170 [Sphingomonas oligophenolica]